MTTWAYRFRRDCLVHAPGVSTPFWRIHTVYADWCRKRGRPVSHLHLEQELEVAGYRDDPDAYLQAFLGIRLREAGDDSSLRDLLRAYDARSDWRDVEVERVAKDADPALIADIRAMSDERLRLVQLMRHELRHFDGRDAVCDYLWKKARPNVDKIRFERYLSALPPEERLARIERLRNLPREHDLDDLLDLPLRVDGGEVGGVEPASETVHGV